jgi:hypothetical protein
MDFWDYLPGGLVDAIFQTKKELKKYCLLRNEEVTISKENVLGQYRMTMFCYFCRQSTSFYAGNNPCNEERCVYHIENAVRAENAMDKKLGYNPSLSNRVLHQKVERLSLDEYTDLTINFGRNKEIQQYCK